MSLFYDIFILMKACLQNRIKTPILVIEKKITGALK